LFFLIFRGEFAFPDLQKRLKRRPPRQLPAAPACETFPGNKTKLDQGLSEWAAAPSAAVTKALQDCDVRGVGGV
jgi:hypothetical protein